MKDKAIRAARLASRSFQRLQARLARRHGPVIFRGDAALDDYEGYLDRQVEKTLDRAEKLQGPLWQVKIDGFTELFGRYTDILHAGQKALCVGARTGQEVVVLKEMGLDAVGIDLVAFPPHVLSADMHDMPFEDMSFDFVFTNCFDHSPKPDHLIAEMERVCRPGGYCMIWLQIGNTSDYYAENAVYDPANVIPLFLRSEVVAAQHDKTIFDGMNFSILALRKM